MRDVSIVEFVQTVQENKWENQLEKQVKDSQKVVENLKDGDYSVISLHHAEKDGNWFFYAQKGLIRVVDDKKIQMFDGVRELVENEWTQIGKSGGEVRLPNSNGTIIDFATKCEIEKLNEFCEMVGYKKTGVERLIEDIEKQIEENEKEIERIMQKEKSDRKTTLTFIVGGLSFMAVEYVIQFLKYLIR